MALGQASQLVAAQLALLAKYLRDDARLQGFRRELKVGGHIVHVFFDPRATEVALTAGAPRYKSPPDYSWIVGLIVVAVIIVLIWLLR